MFFDTGTPLAGTVLFFPIGRASVKFIHRIIKILQMIYAETFGGSPYIYMITNMFREGINSSMYAFVKPKAN